MSPSIQENPVTGSILIVDDNPKNLKVLQRILESKSYKVHPATSGGLALRSLEKIRPDLILLDINMPGMNGYETCEKIKSINDTKNIPIIFISALDNIHDKIKAFEQGGIDYIVKPFQIEEVLARVDTHLTLKKTRETLESINHNIADQVIDKTRKLEESITKYKALSNKESILANILHTSSKEQSIERYIQTIVEEIKPLLNREKYIDSMAIRLTENNITTKHTFFFQPGYFSSEKTHRFLQHLSNNIPSDYKGNQYIHFEKHTQKRSIYCTCQRQAITLPCPQLYKALDCHGIMIPMLCKEDHWGFIILCLQGKTTLAEDDRLFYQQIGEMIAGNLHRRSTEKIIEHLAFHDELTDLPNRRLLNDRISQECHLAQRNNTTGAVLYLDLDGFKLVNDALGHDVGDEVLKLTARRLTDILRDTDSCARWGGDEFIVLLPSLSEDKHIASESAHLVADKIKHAIIQPYHINNHDIQLSISIGVTLFGNENTSTQALLSEADSAMYQAKKSGKNTVRFFKPEYQSSAESRLTMLKGLKNARHNNELSIVYQPQVNQRGDIIGLESLMRWNNPDFGQVSPEKFIALAEESNLIIDLDEFALNTSCQQYKQWQEMGVLPKSFNRIAINICPTHFAQDNFTETVLNILQSHSMPADCLELEMTERVMLNNIDKSIKKLDTLKQHGISFAIDDFGTGYSSLAYLLKLPLDILKIDRSFVSHIHKNQQAITLVSTIIGMAKNLGLSTIAEGVEEEDEFSYLVSNDCDFFQGYKFYKPLTAKQTTELFIAKSKDKGACYGSQH